jgi:hypothetical protein
MASKPSSPKPIHHAMAAGTHRIGDVFGEALARGQRAVGSKRRKAAVGSGRWVRHLLAEKMVAHEVAAHGRRCFAGLAGQGEEHRLAQNAGPSG